jgi:hypothetical protein
VKEVQYAVIDRFSFDPQLVNIVAQIVRFGSPKFMSELVQSLKPNEYSVFRLRRQTVKPSEKRSLAVLLGIDVYLSLRQYKPQMLG